MLVKRIWEKSYSKSKYRKHYKVRQEGWFLFGLIPLYIHDISVREDF